MRVVYEPLPEAKLIEPSEFSDNRGNFVKTFHPRLFAECGINFAPVEEFFSTSRKGVVRGMHCQLPPHSHDKLVYCIRGRVLDVLVDLRKTLPTYGKFASAELSEKNHRMFFIPTGIAHGFLSLEDDSVMVYKTSTVHWPEHDAGIRWNSFGFDWGIGRPIISGRDEGLPQLQEFVSPF